MTTPDDNADDSAPAPASASASASTSTSTSTSASDDHEFRAACRERLSALMDGELSGEPLHRACGHFREAAESRSTWHVYHLIGDVLRSDDLAGGADRNANFLQTFRERLAEEPVVLAPAAEGFGRSTPASAPASNRATAAGRSAWRGRGAATAGLVAAGVVAVAGLGGRLHLPRDAADGIGAKVGSPLALAGDTGGAVASRTRSPAETGSLPETGSPAETVSPPAGGSQPAAAASSGTSAAEPRALLPGDPLIRDARLDRYLRAHQQFAGSSALGVPSGFLRAATAETVAR